MAESKTFQDPRDEAEYLRHRLYAILQENTKLKAQVDELRRMLDNVKLEEISFG